MRDVSWDELAAEVQTIASALVASGVTVGDRVAAVISNSQEAIASCLATLSLGALWSTSAPDMGHEGILSRLLQIRPKIVICESEVLYNGKHRDKMAQNELWAKELCEAYTVEAIVVLPPRQDNLRSDLRMIRWNDFLSRATKGPLVYTQVPFDHPAFIVYSSGTSGLPKCIVHSGGGLLMQVRKDAILHYDVRPGDTILQYTTTSWIMWSMVLVSLSFGGKVVVYDGSPLMPDPMVLLRLVSQLKVSTFGTSAKFLTHLKASGIRPQEIADLSQLRTVTSTGSILTSNVAAWFYDEAFPKHVHLHSTCGGTDLACSLISGNPTLPLYSGEIQGPSLGMAVDVLSIDEASPVSIKFTGAPGDLACMQPFPSQPVLFWGDTDHSKYRDTYFEKFGPHVWIQGDFVSMNPTTGGWTVHGRSDGVLNPAGVRFGSAEIYNVIQTFPQVDEALCVGQRRKQDDDEHLVLFLQMKPSHLLTKTLYNELKTEISQRLSKRHVPRYIFTTPDIPYTANGKKIENLVKKIISGHPVKVGATVQNPQCLAFYEGYLDIEGQDQAQRRAWKPARI